MGSGAVECSFYNVLLFKKLKAFQQCEEKQPCFYTFNCDLSTLRPLFEYITSPFFESSHIFEMYCFFFTILFSNFWHGVTFHITCTCKIHE